MKLHNCQNCNSNTNTVLSLGYMPPCNAMQHVGDPLKVQFWLPSELTHCPTCDLVQLEHVTAPEDVFPADYPYVSGSTKILRDNFADLYKECFDKFALKPEDLIIDIGSNDGTLLSNFQKRHRVIGIEPTDTAKLAIGKGIPTYQQYFTPMFARQLLTAQGTARLITCANCFAHIPDVHAVIDGVLDLLAPDGVFVTESHYLMGLLNTLQYDTIYHEHLRYYSVRALASIFEQHGLEIFDVKMIPTHGGSIRVYASRKVCYPISDSVSQIMNSEPSGNALADRLKIFASEVESSRLTLLSKICKIKQRGEHIVGISAPSRASTVVTYCGLNAAMIDYVVEIEGSPKLGRYMPGTTIPVVEESRLIKDQPQYAVLFSWHIADELIPKLRQRGYKGQFILPCSQAVSLTAVA